MNTYRVYHMNNHVATFSNRDDALQYIYSRHNPAGDYEILDDSDFI